MKVRTQITLSVTALVVLVVGLAGLTIALRIDHRDRTDVDRTLAGRAEKLRGDVGKLITDGDGPPNDGYGGLLVGSQSLVRLFSNGTVRNQGDQPPAEIPTPTADGYQTIVLAGESWRSLVETIDDSTRIQLLQSLETVEERRADNARIVGGVALLAALGTAIGVWIVAGLVLQPLQRLRVGALRIRPEDADERLPEVTRPREVADLSATLNFMLDRLQTSMLATRRFTADAGHELRTPLTSLGVDLEAMLRNPHLPDGQRVEMLSAMAAEHQRIVALLDGLQTLARGDAAALPTRTPVDLAETVRAAVDRARRNHPGVFFGLEFPGGRPIVEGWSAGLVLAVDNLLNNAALHGRPNGVVDVSVLAEGGLAHVVVSDDGPGIPAEQREAMKGRFTRGERPRGPGSGLGLALAEQQAVLHGGRLVLDQGHRGGLRATMTLIAVTHGG